jgi:hypothetical protein
MAEEAGIGWLADGGDGWAFGVAGARTAGLQRRKSGRVPHPPKNAMKPQPENSTDSPAQQSHLLHSRPYPPSWNMLVHR